MKLPRDLSAEDLIKLLARFGYQVTRQTGSHMRLTTQEKGQHHITIPNHPSLRIGTLSSILAEVAGHFQLSRDEIVEGLSGKKK